MHTLAKPVQTRPNQAGPPRRTTVPTCARRGYVKIVSPSAGSQRTDTQRPGQPSDSPVSSLRLRCFACFACVMMMMMMVVDELQLATKADPSLPIPSASASASPVASPCKASHPLPPPFSPTLPCPTPPTRRACVCVCVYRVRPRSFVRLFGRSLGPSCLAHDDVQRSRGGLPCPAPLPVP